ncbi:hypothetical protein AX769_11725 [Frondihabitans sp. PAMC 28766]|uniref:hypothetical protein n=1 Tax=Frondihabitans sp. PAMC 28766 TaxID=1795630 RepID=UPI00078C8923|nr:hypothetical protein [Frondihabitans sp. PAMC 28766]AMM20687.1 hypothetical protein AX769_11725 [Frondihabitans sp. PAMC 28766]
MATSARPPPSCSAGATRFGGSVGLVGVGKPEPSVTINALAGRTFSGLVEGDTVPQTFIPQLIALNAKGDFPFDRLITK